MAKVRAREMVVVIPAFKSIEVAPGKVLRKSSFAQELRFTVSVL
jgi:hypothetical protein